MNKKGSYILGKEIILWIFKITVLLIVIAYVNFYILGAINIIDDTKDALFKSFVSRAEYCVESNEVMNDKILKDCFGNSFGKYGVRLVEGDKSFVVNANMFKNKEVKCKKYDCKEKGFYLADKDGEFEKYKLEVVYNA